MSSQSAGRPERATSAARTSVVEPPIVVEESAAQTARAPNERSPTRKDSGPREEARAASRADEEDDGAVEEKGERHSPARTERAYAARSRAATGRARSSKSKSGAWCVRRSPGEFETGAAPTKANAPGSLARNSLKSSPPIVRQSDVTFLSPTMASRASGGAVCFAGVVDESPALPDVGGLRRAARDDCGCRGDSGHESGKRVDRTGFEGAAGARQDDTVGEDVEGGSSVDGRNRDHGGRERREPPRNDGLERLHDVRGGQNRVGCLVGRGGVSSPAGHLD